MKYAWVGSERTEARPGLKGACPGCGKATFAKSGRAVIWHWAHHPVRHCDPWWQGEAECHRTWKNHFAPEEQEVVHRGPATGEIHIADIKNEKRSCY